MDVRLEDGKTLMGTSRTVAVAGIGKSMADARENSLQGIQALYGPLRHRVDVVSAGDIRGSAKHLRKLRARRTRTA